MRPRQSGARLPAGIGRAFWTDVADRIQHVTDCGDRPIGRDAGRRILAGDQEGAGAGVGIGTVLRPSRVPRIRGSRRPPSGPTWPIPRSSGRPVVVPSSSGSQSLLAARRTNPWVVPPFRAAIKGQGFRIAGLFGSPPVHRPVHNIDLSARWLRLCARRAAGLPDVGPKACRRRNR